MPERLPRFIQASFLFRKSASWALFLVRCFIVSVVWLAFVPWAHINFLRASFEAVDLFVWLLGGAQSSWSGIESIALNATQTALASASAPATPSPPLRRKIFHSIPRNATNASIRANNATIGGSQGLSALTSTAANATLFSASGLGRLLQLIALVEPTGLFGLCLGLVTGLLGSRNDHNAGHSGLEQTPIAAFALKYQDIFRGQVLTCAIVVAVLAVWFTREWVVMQLPAHVPDLADEEAPNPGGDNALMGREAQMEPPAHQQLPETATRAPNMEESLAQLQFGTRFLQEPPADPAERELWERQESWDRALEMMAAAEEIRMQRAATEARRQVFNVPQPDPPTDPSDDGQDVDMPLDPHRLRSARLARFVGRDAALIDGPSSPTEVSRDGLDSLVYASTAPAAHHRRPDSSGTHSRSGSLSDQSIFHSRSPDGSDPETSSLEASHRLLATTSVGHEQDSSVGPADSLAANASEGVRVDQPQTQVGRGGDSDLNEDPTLHNTDTESSATEFSSIGGNEGNESGTDELHRPAPAHPRRQLRPRRRLDNGVGLEGADIRRQLPRNERDPAMGVLQENGGDDAAAQPAVPAGEEVAWADEIEGEIEGMLEAIGFRGDPIHFFANVSIVIALCFIFVILVIAVPYFLGRMFGLGKGFVDVCTAPVRLLRLVTDPVVDWTIETVADKMGLGNAKGRSDPTSTASIVAANVTEALLAPLHDVSDGKSTSSFLSNAITNKPFAATFKAFAHQLGGLPTFLKLNLIGRIERTVIHASSSWIDRTICAVLGHAWWMAITAGLLAIESKRYRGIQVMQDRPIWWLREFIAQALIVVKVLFFLCIEIIVFPIGCGIVIDFCTLPLLGATFSNRLADLTSHPLAWVFVRWAVGTLWMFRFGLYVSHVRSILRSGVLSWIRDPEDPDFQPIKEILDRKASTQLRKIGASAVMYASLIVALFGVNLWAAWLLLPTSWAVLPLRSGTSCSPLDLVMILVVTPYIVQHSEWEQFASRLSIRWWRMAAYHTGLTHFLLDAKAAHKADPNAAATLEVTATQAHGSDEDSRTFLARVAASDNSIIGSPLLIELDSQTGEPKTDKGKEALRVQLEKLEKMQQPKAKYTTLRLPRPFAKRIMAVLALLWASMSMGLFGLFLPLLLGRKITGGKQIDTYAFAVGALILSPVMWSLGHLLRLQYVRTKLESPLVGGQPSKARKGKKSPNGGSTATQGPSFRRRAWKVLRRIRRLLTISWLCVTLGLITPTLLGLAVDQILISHLRFAIDEVSQTSLMYAWAMGVLEQELVLQGLPYLPESRLHVAVRELQRRGFKRAKAWATTRDLVIPLTGACSTVILAPLGISALLERVLLRGEDRNDGTVETLASAARLFVLVAVLVAALVELLLGRMGQFDRELRDQMYLQASELLNYGEAEKSTTADGKPLDGFEGAGSTELRNGNLLSGEAELAALEQEQIER